jgi:uncharacterized OB-fold protein
VLKSVPLPLARKTHNPETENRMSDPSNDRFDFVPGPPLSGDPLAGPYFEGLARCQLRVQRCRDCGFLQHPPRPVCRRCTSLELGTRRLSGRGLIVDISDQFETMDPFADGDLVFQQAIVELIEQDGLLILTKVVTPPNAPAAIGMAVNAHFPSTAFGERSLAFRPDDDASGGRSGSSSAAG